jgi:hypothetical protein
MRRHTSSFAIALVCALSVGFRLGSDKPSITSPNNVYLYDTLMLVSDSINGLLVYSVADERSPKFKARIPLQGNRGMAMKDSIIYANSWSGILALQIVNDTDYKVTCVVKNDPYNNGQYFYDDYHPYSSSSGWFDCGTKNFLAGASSENSLDMGGSGGVGGSYAIFAVIDSFLYYIDNSSLITMDISNAAAPRKISETYVDWSIETLFPTEKYLFIGGSAGMYVLDRSDPKYPKRIGAVTHFRARDPVVVRDTMAYVTLRAGWDFRASADELMVVNLKEITSPKLVKEIPLATPFGLAVSDTLLYIAQGGSGWSLFGLSNPSAPVKLKQWTAPSAKDFIWIKDRLYVMCLDRVMIYSAADPFNPTPVSEID